MILQQNYNTIYAAEGSVEAGTEGIAKNGNYELRITEGTPSYSPKVPKLSDREIAIDKKNGKPVDKKLPNDITAKFKVALEFCPPQGKREDVARHAKNTTMAVEVTDDEFMIKKVGTWNETYSNNYRNFTCTPYQVPIFGTDVVLRAFTPGEKTVKMSIKTTINNVTLETSKTIKISVPDYIFTVYKRDGTYEKQDEYSIPFPYQPGKNKLDVGHLAWKVEVYKNQLSNFDPAETRGDHANQIWGLGPTYTDVNDDNNVDKALFTYMDNNKDVRPIPEINISVPGTLYKNGSQGKEKVSFSFTDTKDKNNKITSSALQNAQAVLDYTNTILGTPANCLYQVPRFNCVDQVISSMNVGDLPAPEYKIPNVPQRYMPDGITYVPDYENCRRNYRFKFPRRRGTIDFNMRLSVPQKFIDQYESNK